MAFFTTDLRTTNNAKPKATVDVAAQAAMAPAEKASNGEMKLTISAISASMEATFVMDANADSTPRRRRIKRPPLRAR